jgi:hypothetical protein
MKSISINKDTSVRIDTFEWQISPNGNNFRLSGIRKNSQLPAKWLESTYKWHWFYDFIYEDGKQFSIEIDYNNKFVQLIKK